MPESTFDESVLIAISFQAHNRAKQGDKFITLCDCIVMIVFAGFFIEANLNHIIEVMGKEQEVLDFWAYRKGTKLGMKNKLAWFYNSFATNPKINLINATKNQKEKLKDELYERLRVGFPGFDEIYNFRNGISHGKIDSSTANLVDAERLRQQAKNIVNELFRLAENAGYHIPRDVRAYDVMNDI
jgi:hypothetical protein